jgi:hypothetical protein
MERIIMTTFDTPQPNTAGTAAGNPAGTPNGAGTPTTPDAPSIDAIASQLQTLLDQMQALVPDLRPHDPRQIARVAAAARYAQQLIPPAITTVTSVSAVPVGLIDPDGGRAAMAYHDQLFPIAQQAQAFIDALLFSINSVLATWGEKALQTYHWSKRAVKGPDGPELQPYVEEMVRVVKKANNKRKPKGTTNPPAPAPQPGTPAPAPAPGPASQPGPVTHTLLPFRPEAEELDDDYPRSIYDLVDDEAA